MDTNSHNDPTIVSNPGTEKEELSMDNALLKKLREVVERNLKNEQFSVEDLAEEVAYSRSQLHRKLHHLTGQSCSQFIRAIRLEHSLDYLRKDVGTVSEIGYRVGFQSSSYFIKCFHQHYGFPPGEVKNKELEGWFQREERRSPEPHDETLKVLSQPLESLHPASSESLILEIFEEMVRHKASLEKFLIVDEEEGETVDIRLLAYQMIKSYPWPIGVEIRRLFSGELRQPGELRFNQLQKTIRRCLKLTGFILVSQLVDLVARGDIRMEDNPASELEKSFKNLGAESIIKLIKVSTGLINSVKKDLFIEDLVKGFDDSFYLQLRDWIDLDSEEKNGEGYEELCGSLEQVLLFVLKKLACMVQYKLVNVSAIKVLKGRFETASFEHEFHILNSTDAEFKVHEEIMEEYADSNAVLLMKSIKDPKTFLNLSPLVIDTHGESVRTGDKSHLKKDIFLFDKFDNGELIYNGSEVKSVNNLKVLDSYEKLIEEYQEMLNLITK